ncbi:DUF3019 domain-containing protein [Paraglaciecola chathamensis]|uniref:DUF3019 domain-containing protein n=1 Tax=Paraglaciecola chathamensis TaxID=368405 RepID=A0ABS0WCT9_9ALTE|nr:DUF3019 domain-containing protein [Paraglaciecola chathamensis]MBJ2136296.1 DUF3019 domain-containing protein [Paraglaciecola chathamensis]
MRVLLTCLGIVGCVLPSVIKAEEHHLSWLIQPNVCVAERANEPCTFTLSVEIHNNKQQTYCVYLSQLSEQRLFCSTQRQLQRKLSLTIDNKASLLLKNSLGVTVSEQTLRVKSTQLRTRFRVNSPWSLF